MRGRPRRYIVLPILAAVVLTCLFAPDRFVTASSVSGSPHKDETSDHRDLTVSDGSPPECPPTSDRSLWAGDRRVASALRLEDGCRSLALPSDQLEDIAADNNRGLVWVAEKDAVVQYDLSGTELVRHAIRSSRSHNAADRTSRMHADLPHNGGDKREPHPRDDGDDAIGGGQDRVRISLDPSDGSLWIGTGHDVVKLSAGGQLLLERRSKTRIADVAVDLADGTCWIGAGKSVTRYDSGGNRLSSFALEDKNAVVALATDPRDHFLWIASPTGIMKVDGQGIEILRISMTERIRDIAVNVTTGSLWVVTDQVIYHYDGQGELIFKRALCGNEEGEVSRDGKTGGIAEAAALADHSRAAGKERQTGTRSGNIEDRDGCEGSGRRDAPGGCAKDARGKDDHDNTHACAGLVALAVNSSDNTCWVAAKRSLWKLNETGEALLAIKGLQQLEALDIGIPKLGVRISSPQAGTLFTSSLIERVTGTISIPAAVVHVNGKDAAVDGLAFESMNIPLSEGTNTITATATDLFRQQASDSIVVTHQASTRTPFFVCAEPYWEQWLKPPDPGCSRIALLNVWNYSYAYVLGYAEESSTDVTVDGISLPYGVEIYNRGRILIGSWSGTFFWAWMHLPGPDGAYAVTASATDSQGVTTSSEVSIVKDTVQPELAITAPAKGMITSGSTVTVTGAINDPSATVMVGWGGQTIPLVNGSFTVLYELAPWDGPQDLVVTAFDPAGNPGYASVEIIRDTTPPRISIVTPAEGAVVSSATVSITGQMVDATPDSITVSINGGQPQPLLLSGEAVAGSVSLSRGTNLLHIEARDKAGHGSSLTRNIILDDELPAVKIVSPAPGDELSGQASVDVAATDTISGIRSVALLVNGRVLGVSAQQPYTFAIDTLRFSAGSHTLTARAVDNAGNISEANAVITVQKQLGIEITSPGDGATVRGSNVLVTGRTDPFANSETGITVNGVPAHQSGTEFAALVPVQGGVNTVTAVVSNAYGISEQASITISADPLVEPVRLIANPSSGIVMLRPGGSMNFETRLHAEASLPGDPVSYSWDADGDGVVDQQGIDLKDITVVYAKPGLYYPSVSVTDSQGNTAMTTTVVNVVDRASIDALLQAKWEGMKERLVERDIEGALQHFIPGSQGRYRDILSAIKDVLPQMAKDMRSVQLVYLRDGIGKYRIRRSEMTGGVMSELTYYIYFTLDKDAVWRIAYF